MSYSFISDVYPKWKDNNKTTCLESMTAGIDLYENFETSNELPKMPQPQSTSMSGVVPPPNDVKGLLTESFTDYNLPLKTNNGSGPQPFDTDGDYFKLLSEDWYEDTARYQANARSPFQPKDYAEEDQVTNSSTSSNSECIGVAQHLDGCKECRTRLEHIFRKLLGKAKETKKKIVSSSLSANLIDVMLLVGIGIFVIFLLDGFVKLGRFLKSN